MLDDTNPAARDAYIAWMRSQSPITRVDALAALIRFSREILEMRIRAVTPDVTAEELQRQIGRLVYGQDVAP